METLLKIKNMNKFNAKQYWETRLSNNYSIQSVGYLGLGQKYNNWLYKVQKNVFLRIAKSLNLNLENIDVIDIGSGTGFYIELWQSLGVRNVVGTDITDIAVEKLKFKFPDSEFYKLDIGSNINPDQCQQYDIVSAMDVLFHIIDDDSYDQAIQNIASLLRQDGLFIFSDNFLHNATERGKHQVNRSLDEIEAILKKNNFEIVQRLPMQVLMNFPVDSQNTLYKVIWRSLAFPVKKSEIVGLIVGGILYPVEIFLASTLKESPTTEIMICRKNK